jgi:hypothetical protein
VQLLGGILQQTAWSSTHGEEGSLDKIPERILCLLVLLVFRRTFQVIGVAIFGQHDA